MKPILFNTRMVRAILDGRKTETRRVVKPQPGEELAYIFGGHNRGKWGYSPYNEPRYEEHRKAHDWKYWTPPCHSDDTLWVRETFRKNDMKLPWEPTGDYIYRADVHPLDDSEKWHPSIHMPKEAARLFLRVTGVRVERLQEITAKDAGEEGIEWETDNSGQYRRAEFAKLWDSTIKPEDLDKYGWAANPWVWVINFERCEKPGGSK